MGMIGRKRLLENVQCLTIVLISRFVKFLCVVQYRQVVQGQAHFRMAAAQHFFLDRQGPVMLGFGLVVLASILRPPPTVPQYC